MDSDNKAVGFLNRRLALAVFGLTLFLLCQIHVLQQPTQARAGDPAFSKVADLIREYLATQESLEELAQAEKAALDQVKQASDELSYKLDVEMPQFEVDFDRKIAEAAKKPPYEVSLIPYRKKYEEQGRAYKRLADAKSNHKRSLKALKEAEEKLAGIYDKAQRRGVWKALFRDHVAEYKRSKLKVPAGSRFKRAVKGRRAKVVVAVAVGVAVVLVASDAEARQATLEQLGEARDEFVKDVGQAAANGGGGAGGRVVIARVLEYGDLVSPVSIGWAKDFVDPDVPWGDALQEAALSVSDVVGATVDIALGRDREVPVKRFQGGADEGVAASFDGKDRLVGGRERGYEAPTVIETQEAEQGSSSQQLERTVSGDGPGSNGAVGTGGASTAEQEQEQKTGSAEQLKAGGAAQGGGGISSKSESGSEKQHFAAAYGATAATGASSESGRNQNGSFEGKPGGSGGGLSESDLTGGVSGGSAGSRDIGVDIVTGADGGKKSDSDGKAGSTENQVDCADGGCGPDHPGSLGGQPNPDDPSGCGSGGGNGCRDFGDVRSRTVLGMHQELAGLVRSLLTFISVQRAADLFGLDGGGKRASALLGGGRRRGALYEVLRGLFTQTTGAEARGSSVSRSVGLGLTGLLVDWAAHEPGSQRGRIVSAVFSEAGTGLSSSAESKGHGTVELRGARTMLLGQRTAAVRKSVGLKYLQTGRRRTVTAVRQRLTAPAAAPEPLTTRQTPTALSGVGSAPVARTQESSTKLVSPGSVTSQLQNPSTGLSYAE